jgi:hypothetical protein
MIRVRWNVDGEDGSEHIRCKTVRDLTKRTGQGYNAAALNLRLVSDCGAVLQSWIRCELQHPM